MTADEQRAAAWPGTDAYSEWLRQGGRRQRPPEAFAQGFDAGYRAGEAAAEDKWRHT
jgi:hypothetical protein